MTHTTLNGHYDAQTAYTVDDYPYGFRLRCKIRYWLEYKEGKGFRFVSQTTNPKKAAEVWNTPKASTYAAISAVMFLDENNHVQWNCLSQYSSRKEAEAFRDNYQLEGIALERCTKFINAHLRYEARKAAATAANS